MNVSSLLMPIRLRHERWRSSLTFVSWYRKSSPFFATIRSISSSATRTTRRRASSSDLLGTRRELLIDHLGEVYVLRHTSKGKLILTK